MVFMFLCDMFAKLVSHVHQLRSVETARIMPLSRKKLGSERNAAKQGGSLGSGPRARSVGVSH